MRRTARYDRIQEEDTAYNHDYEFATLHGGPTVVHHTPAQPSEYNQFNSFNAQDTAYNSGYESTALDEESMIEHHVPNKPSEYDQVTGNRLQRFHLRAIVGVLGPFVVCAYFIIIWRLYLVPAQDEGPVTFGIRGAKWIFYSWFVAGVLGLSLSLYGLTGVEASMLMEPTWNVGDASKLMLHADTTWSGPGGWMKTIRWALIPQKGSHRRSPPYLWFMLAIPSALVFIAWPLSGLTMETTQGYCRSEGTTSTPVTGFSYDTFNERGYEEVFQSAGLAWRSGRSAQIPGAGIIYTPAGFDRSPFPFLNQIPAVLPIDDGVPTIFLIPQADTPVEGNHWGLLLKYNCKIIDRAEDFRVLNKFTRASTRYSRLGPGLSGPGGYYSELSDDRNTRVSTINKTDRRWARNFDMVAEVGTELWVVNKMPLKSQGPWVACYTRTNQSTNGDYPGIENDRIFEVALWQGLEDQYRINVKNFSLLYNRSIDHNITGYYGAYKGERFHKLHSKKGSLPMTAIGVQCLASSSVGRADINGFDSSYSNFQRTDTRPSVSWNRCAQRFNEFVPFPVMRNKRLYKDWAAALFSSSGGETIFSASHHPPDADDPEKMLDFSLQPNFLQAEQLRRSMLSAYASYAVQLVYNGGDAYTTSKGSTLRFINPNGTAFQRATVIKPGVVPAVLPLGLFCLWALLSSTLGLIYGFRRRWAETLDGHTMFRLGAELSDHARRELLKTSNIGKKEDDETLKDIPGLIGDAKPEIDVGRIGLVASAKAEKKKFYE